MVINRRDVLKAALSLCCVPLVGTAHSAQSVQFVSTLKYQEQFYLAGVDGAGEVVYRTLLPARAHDVVLHPSGKMGVVVARRPGQFLCLFDVQSGRLIHTQSTPEDCHLYGHAVFDPSGEWLYTTENRYDRAEGLIRLWRWSETALMPVDEWKLPGVGPHELVLMPDGKRLAVALGGIETHPSTGRQPLNLDSMHSSLLLLSRDNGELLQQFDAPVTRQRLSLRHLAVSAKGDLVIAGQFQGGHTETGALLARLPASGEALQWLQPPLSIHRRMRNYCGSVAATRSGDWFAVSAPKGNLITFWRANDGAFVSSVRLRDGCGLASTPADDSFWITSGGGEILRYNPAQQSAHPLATNAEQRWDNHAVPI